MRFPGRFPGEKTGLQKENPKEKEGTYGPVVLPVYL
jgi:hypothetical protein